jgi:triacylglycerol lipase
MLKLTRRQLLLGGFTVGAIATGIYKQQQLELARKRQLALETLAKAELSKKDPREQLNEWFGKDGQRAKGAIEIQPEPAQLAPPRVPYDHAMSRLLIGCCALTTHQYVLGKLDETYNGEIKTLPTFPQSLIGYTQIAALRGSEDDKVNETVEVDIPFNTTPPMEDSTQRQLQDAGFNLHQRLKEAVKLSRKIPVFWGYVLISPKHNIIAFRGTNREAEAIMDALVFQNDYPTSGYGKVHAGFLDVYQSLALQVQEAAKKMNPALPCYITGHSLGGALATLAALDLAITLPQLKNRIQLYTYASPRVGNPAFATKHSQLLPNCYRVVNLGDTIPLTPPFQIYGNQYAHIGQMWSFLANTGDVTRNHMIVTYQTAVTQTVETNQPRTYPVTGF